MPNRRASRIRKDYKLRRTQSISRMLFTTVLREPTYDEDYIPPRPGCGSQKYYSQYRYNFNPNQPIEDQL